MNRFMRPARLRGAGVALFAAGVLWALTVPVAQAVAPTITSFSPTSGAVRTGVTINGTGLTGATAVSFGGASATYTVDSDTKITATVPDDAETGPISVVTPGGSATSSSDFTVILTRRDVQINRTKTEFASGPNEGDFVYLWGAGSWDTATGLLNIGGRILHKGADGSTVAKGYWKATEFVSFTSYGTVGAPIVLEGGLLVLEVKVFPSDGSPVVVDDFTVDCLLGTPPAGAEEGVRIPSIGLTESIEEPGRFTVFEQV